MPQIQLQNSKLFTLVDKEDYLILSKFHWHKNTQGYAVRSYIDKNTKKELFIRMHREIMDTPKDLYTDHINHNRLDNRRKNLRVCTQSQNSYNIFKNNKKATSIYKGVVKENRKDYKLKNPWRAYIHKNKQKIHLGYFKTESEAGLAYNKAVKNITQGFGILNKIYA